MSETAVNWTQFFNHLSDAYVATWDMEPSWPLAVVQLDIARTALDANARDLYFTSRCFEVLNRNAAKLPAGSNTAFVQERIQSAGSHLGLAL